jgi:DnaJ-domain-containing protein 1
LLGGPLGAAVVGSISYVLNKNIQKQDEKSATESYHQQVAKLCIAAAEDYLSSFSNQALSILAEYEKKSDKIISFEGSKEPLDIAQKRQDVQRWQNNFNQLLRELAKANIPSNFQPYKEIRKFLEIKREYQPPEDRFKTYAEANTTYKSHQEKTTQNTKTRVETPRQQVSSPQPPSASPEKVEAQFRAWELDEEIAQMKAEMGSGGFKTGKQQNTPNNQSPHKPKTQAEKDKINRAYGTLGLQPDASFVEVKQAYRNFVKRNHPDLFVNQPQLLQKAEAKMRQVNEAYTILSEQIS